MNLAQKRGIFDVNSFIKYAILCLSWTEKGTVSRVGFIAFETKEHT